VASQADRVHCRCCDVAEVAAIVHAHYVLLEEAELLHHEAADERGVLISVVKVAQAGQALLQFTLPGPDIPKLATQLLSGTTIPKHLSKRQEDRRRIGRDAQVLHYCV